MKLLIHNYKDELLRLAADASEIKVMVAFLTEGGICWIPDSPSTQIQFIVGIDREAGRRNRIDLRPSFHHDSPFSPPSQPRIRLTHSKREKRFPINYP